jgi:hypothetical protein
VPLVTLQSAKGYGFGSFQTPAVLNSYESIATYSLSASTSSVTFSSIPSTFTHLQVRCLLKSTAAGDDAWAYSLQAYLNTDTTVGNYAFHRIYGDGGTITVGGAANAIGQLGFIPSSGSGVTDVFAPTIIDILDYRNTNKYTVFKAINGSNTNGVSGGFAGIQSQVWKNTNAVTSIEFRSGSGGSFAQYSHFALYGIKGV